MISESDSWKEELRRLIKNLIDISDETTPDDTVNFRFEMSLLQSAIIVRRLIECRKITDVNRKRHFDIQIFSTRPNRVGVLMHLLMKGDIDKEFDLSKPIPTQMDAWSISNELIHSGFLAWETSDDDRITAICVASIRYKSRRLLRVPLATYISILAVIAADNVTKYESKIDDDGKLAISVS